jgi:hypothetical protein
MAEFEKRELHIKYKNEIQDWFIYLDQQEFGKKLEIQMMEEVDRFMATKESTEELIERVFGKHEWEIEYLNNIGVKSIIDFTEGEFAWV